MSKVTKTARYKRLGWDLVRVVEVGMFTKNRVAWTVNVSGWSEAVVDGVKVQFKTSVYQGYGSAFLMIPGLGDYRFMMSSSSESYSVGAEALLERAVKGGAPLFPSLQPAPAVRTLAQIEADIQAAHDSYNAIHPAKTGRAMTDADRAEWARLDTKLNELHAERFAA